MEALLFLVSDFCFLLFRLKPEKEVQQTKSSSSFKLPAIIISTLTIKNMLSSADLHLEKLLILTVLTIFFGAGFFCTLIIFIINSVRKKKKNGLYYVLYFLFSGILILVLAAFYFYTMLLK